MDLILIVCSCDCVPNDGPRVMMHPCMYAAIYFNVFDFCGRRQFWEM
jgi:hypothetical protein